MDQISILTGTHDPLTRGAGRSRRFQGYRHIAAVFLWSPCLLTEGVKAFERAAAGEGRSSLVP